MSTIIVSGSSPSTISVSIPQVNTIVVTPPEVRTVSATLNIGSAGTPGQGVAAGGTAGQSLVKLNDGDYATTWDDRLAAVVDDTSPELGGDLNTAGNAINFEDDLGASAGSLAYDNDENTVVYTNADGVSIELGEKNVFYGKASEPISKGDVVMFGGVQGNHLLLKKADQQASGFIPEWVVGFAAQALNTNDFGYVVWFGKLDGLSGYNTSTYSDGDLLYLDPNTAGAVTLTEPTPAQGHSILLAAVLTASDGNAGRIIIRPSHKQDTDEVPEGSTNLYFTDARAQAAVDAFKDNDITFSDANRVADLQSGGSLAFRDDSDQNILYLDESTRSVGVKTAGAPTATLDVGGDVSISNNLTVGGSTVKLANTAVLGVADTERFTIGAVSGSASLDVTATTDFTQIASFSAGIKINGGGSNNVTIDSPSLASSYTITLPADGGTSGYVLSTDGSGTTSWVEQSGGVDTVGTPLVTQISVFTDADTIEGDSNLTWTGSYLNVGGGVNADEILIDAASISSAGNYGSGSRLLSKVGTNTVVTAGDLYYLAAGSWTQANAGAASTSTGLIAIAVSTASQNGMLVSGVIKVEDNTGFSSAAMGDVLYVSTTAGHITDTAPSAVGDIVRVVGYVLDASNGIVYFDPANTWTEL